MNVLDLAEVTVRVRDEDAVDDAASAVTARIVDKDHLAGQSQCVKNLKNFADVAFQDAFLVVAGKDKRQIRRNRGHMTFVSR